MKIKYFILFVGFALALVSCEIDNYDEPESFFTGRVVYNGTPIEVGALEVRFQLFQPGFGNLAPLDVHLDTDGSFSGRFFDGDYKLKFVDGQGPFKANYVNEQAGDTIFIQIKGNTEMDLEVTPYYMVKSSQFSATGNTVSGSISLDKIITGDEGREIEYVNLYINESQFVSNNDDYNIGRADVEVSSLDNIAGSINLPDDYSKNYIYARMGIKIAGVEDLLFSEVTKLDL